MELPRDIFWLRRWIEHSRSLEMITLHAVAEHLGFRCEGDAMHFEKSGRRRRDLFGLGEVQPSATSDFECRVRMPFARRRRRP